MAKKATGPGAQVPSGAGWRKVKKPPWGLGLSAPELCTAAVSSLPGV